MELSGRKLIGNLQKKWTIISVCSDLMVALSIAILIAALIQKISPGFLWIAIPVFLLVLFILASLHKFWKIHTTDIARYLNNQLPEFEESVQLLLKPAGTLNLLESLQVNKVESLLSNTKVPSFHNKQILWSVIVLCISILLAVNLYLLTGFMISVGRLHTEQAVSVVKGSKPETEHTGVSSAHLTIYPPAYMRQNRIEQADAFAIHSVEGANVEWKITTNNPVKKLELIFNDKETEALTLADDSHTTWRTNKVLSNSGFYQVKVDDKLSEMYMIDLLKDQPPVVRILSPKQYVSIGFGEPQQVALKVALTDDYGISTTYMNATIASGSGEGVKFKEQRFPFSGFGAGSRETNLQKTIDLRALGMQPGDELYYYVSAQDNHHQENRSDIYIITLPDTAKLMEIDGMTNSVNLKQEYFRSERQIIIETEQLLKGRDTMSVTAFNNKSNDLGIDQKLLRLRYGKFLGEESDNEIGGHDDHDEPATRDETVFGDATKIIDAFTHKHDNAEDATFFDPKLKEQLKQTLSEMWKAELQLRLYKPQEALPFEYKALLLLKDLQQQSRAYVAKAAYKTTPLRPEKRLTADLTKIVEPATEQTMKQDNQSEVAVRKAAGLMEELKQHALLLPSSQKIVQTAAHQLGSMAVAKPSFYLVSFEAMKRVIASLDHPATIAAADINAAEKGLQLMIAVTGRSPRPEQAGVKQQLSQQYFKNLQQTKR